jgi:hypothetical protein
MTNPPPVTGHFAHADPNASPLTINELIDILNSLLSVKISGSYIPYIIQHGTPGADQSGYAWIELDSGGRPISTRIYYNGKWRKIYSGMIGEIRMYSGDPGDGDVWTPLGHGVVGSDYDGWQICNGNNGSPDLSDRFIIGAHMNDKDGHNKYNKHWQTFVDGKSDLQLGGEKDHMIQMADLPPLDTPNGHAGLSLNGKGWKDGAEHPGSPAAIVDIEYGMQKDYSVPIAAYGSNPNGSPPTPQTPIPSLPPFYALALIIFQGYTS